MASPSWLLLALAVTGAGIPAPDAEATWYWCPDRPRAELQAHPEPGCEPVVARKDPSKKNGAGAVTTPKPLLKPDEIEAAVEGFLRKYRRFLSCCASDPAAAAEIGELDDQALDLLSQLEAAFANDTKMQKTLQGRGTILSLVEARQQLRALTTRRRDIEDALKKAAPLDYESAGREHRTIERLQESIDKDFRPSEPPSRALTGPEIGATSRFGPSIGATGQTGTSIGSAPPAGPDIGTSQPSGPDIGQTPTTGPAIGTVPPTGPDIGNSSLNRR
ncbi:MAG: hypothetical protein EPO64_08360 [Nitrospirae bacterium]|nr:MAG: hypothetical protein EPO64_08360 [Nitrospirota bacterium]